MLESPFKDTLILQFLGRGTLFSVDLGLNGGSNLKPLRRSHLSSVRPIPYRIRFMAYRSFLACLLLARVTSLNEWIYFPLYKEVLLLSQYTLLCHGVCVYVCMHVISTTLIGQNGDILAGSDTFTVSKPAVMSPSQPIRSLGDILVDSLTLTAN